MPDPVVPESRPPQTAPPARKKRPKELAVIDQSGCTGCEVCLEVCPVDCMYTVAGPEWDVYKKLVEIDLDVCIGCKLCVKYCPWDTIEMVDSEKAYVVAKDWTIRTVMADKEWMREGEAETGGFFPSAFNKDRP